MNVCIISPCSEPALERWRGVSCDRQLLRGREGDHAKAWRPWRARSQQAPIPDGGCRKSPEASIRSKRRKGPLLTGRPAQMARSLRSPSRRHLGLCRTPKLERSRLRSLEHGPRPGPRLVEALRHSPKRSAPPPLDDGALATVRGRRRGQQGPPAPASKVGPDPDADLSLAFNA